MKFLSGRDNLREGKISCKEYYCHLLTMNFVIKMENIKDKREKLERTKRKVVSYPQRNSHKTTS